jgi:hypothetical protein
MWCCRWALSASILSRHAFYDEAQPKPALRTPMAGWQGCRASWGGYSATIIEDRSNKMQNVERLQPAMRELDFKGLDEEDRWDEVETFIGDEVKRLNDQADKLTTRAYTLEEIKLDDRRLRKRVEAETRPLTTDTIQEIWLEVTKPDREHDARETALRMKSYRKSEALRYFTVTNARGHTIHILANDAAVARYIAASIGRITSRQHGNLRSFDTVSIEKLPYGHGIEEALAAGYPGVIEIMGTKVIHCSKKEVFG